MTVAVRTNGDATAPENIALLFDWVRALEADPRVARVDSIVSIDERITLAQYQLLYDSPTGAPPDRYVQQLLSVTTNGDLTAVTITPSARAEPPRHARTCCRAACRNARRRGRWRGNCPYAAGRADNPRWWWSG